MWRADSEEGIEREMVQFTVAPGYIPNSTHSYSATPTPEVIAIYINKKIYIFYIIFTKKSLNHTDAF